MTALSDTEQSELLRLLRVIVEEDERFLPHLTYRTFHQLVPWPVVEIIIHDGDGRFVLTYRCDDFTGWHIPGGYTKVGETFQQACDRHVRKEKIVTGVTDLKLIGSHLWQSGEHPFAFPTSLIIVCRPIGIVQESAICRWFKEIPPGVIKEQHPNFLRFFQDWLQGNRGSAAII